MADANLTQAEADALTAMEKRRSDDTEWQYPDLGGYVTIPLVSMDRRESFLLDLRRSQIDLTKGTYQNRGRQVVVLARLDFGGAPHRNPDGEEIRSPHLHVYREGLGDIEDLRVAATTRTYDSAAAVPVYRPFRLVSLLSNGTYSKTLNKWAMPVPCDYFPNLHDAWQTLQGFMHYCHIVEPPVIRRGLFP